MEQQSNFTAEQMKLLEELEDLLNFGYSLIEKVKFNLSKMRPKKIILFSMMGATHSHSEGILCLLKEGRTNSAEVLSRTLIETYINLNFVFTGRTQRNAIRFLLDDDCDRRRLAERIKKFLETNPGFKANLDGMSSPQDWQKFITETNNAIKQMEKYYKKYEPLGLSDLRQRAIEVDKEKEKKTKKELRNRLEWWYLMIYWYFSTITHATARGLNSFFKQDGQNGYIVNVTGDLEAIERIAVTVYSIYFSFLKLFLKQFDIPQPKSFSKYETILKSYMGKK